jgi:hypothetical protein
MKASGRFKSLRRADHRVGIPPGLRRRIDAG